MVGVNIYECSGFVSPKSFKECNNENYAYDKWTAGDNDATNYHTLIGLTGLKVADPKKIIEILKTAVRLFGSEALTPFVMVNMRKQQFASELHFEFLQDTLGYIRTGKRKMNIRMWMQLLSVKRGKLSKKYISANAYTMKPECYRNLGIREWVSHDDGLVDLVYSLYIIFGKYTAWE